MHDRSGRSVHARCVWIRDWCPLELALLLKYSSFQSQQYQKQSQQGGLQARLISVASANVPVLAVPPVAFAFPSTSPLELLGLHFVTLRFTDLPWPKLRVGTQSILCRSHKGAAVPEWNCWSQTLSLFKIFSVRSSRLIAEIHRRLRSMLSSSTSGPRFVTTAGTRHKRTPLYSPTAFSRTSHNQAHWHFEEAKLEKIAT